MPNKNAASLQLDLELEAGMDFIRRTLSNELFPNRRITESVPDLDWLMVNNLLIRHRLAAFFYVLSKSRRDSWPKHFREQLRQSYYSLLLHNDSCASQVKKVLTAFKNANIPVIVLKGWALIMTLYAGDHGQRYCEDIDILVKPQDIDHAEEILQKLGCIGVEESWPGYNRRYMNERAYLTPKQNSPFGRNFSIGLHWGLLHIPAYDPDRIDLDGLFERAVPLTVCGTPVLELSTEDNLAYSSAHLGLHHRLDSALFRYFEIARIILLAGSAFDWQAVLNRASQWGCSYSLKKVLEKVESLWPGVIPGDMIFAISQLKIRSGERFVYAWMQKFTDQPTLLQILTWFTLPGAHRRFGLMLQDIFPGAAFMKKRYGPAPAGIWPLLYFRRLARALQFLFNKLTSTV
ncbi:nucleotidyltransferase family protein [Chloroflexota bacterium]